MPPIAASRVEVEACAREVFEVLPLGIRWLRAAIRRQEPSWSLPQLHTLGFLRRNPGASLADVADHLGVGRPTASTLVSRLVAAGQVFRRDDPAERRRNVLTLTAEGEARHEAALGVSREALTDRLRCLSARELKEVSGALGVLRGIFIDG